MLARLRALADAGNPEGNTWLCEASATPSAITSALALPDCLIAARAGYANSRAILADYYATGNRNPGEALYWATLARSQHELRADLRQLIAHVGAP